LPTQIYTLSLHDALPISLRHPSDSTNIQRMQSEQRSNHQAAPDFPGHLVQSNQKRHSVEGVEENVDIVMTASAQAEELAIEHVRSEEHTSELQSRENLVC